MKAFMAVFLLSNIALSQSVDDLVDILDGSSWESEYKRDDSGHHSAVSKKPLELKGKRTHQDLTCNKKEDQTTIPYKFLLGLMANKALDITHEPHEGVLTIDGGVMIGNCNGMLERIVSEPDEQTPFYSFQVGVRRPSGCDDKTCSYEVLTIENCKNVHKMKSFTPDFSGFVSCLEATGVMNNGKVVKDKIAPLQFLHREVDVTQSSELVYANRGFTGAQYVGKFSDNKLPEYQGCYYFEDVQSGGFKTYSVDDIQDFEQEKLYQKVCNSGNYKLINSHIADFENNDPFQTSLRDIRNELILKEVKALHDIVTDSESLEEVDVPKFKEVTSDFLEYVITPIKTDLAQMQRLYANPGHSQKEDILKSVFGPKKAQALLGKDTKELKSILKEEMDKLATKLVSYARKPYLTKDDFKKMTDADAGAPLDNKTWTGAVLDLYETQLTAFNYGRYSKDFYDTHYKGNPEYKNAKQYAKGSDLDKKIKSKLSITREKIQRVHHVASNPDVDYSRKYEKTKNIILSKLSREIDSTEKKIENLRYMIQFGCVKKKQTKYWKSIQTCISEERDKLIACENKLLSLRAERERVARKYDDMISDWDEAHGKVNRKRSPTSSGDGSFTFTPTTPTTAPHQQNVDNQYSMQLEMMRRQMQMQQTQGPMANAQIGFQLPSIGYQISHNMSGGQPSYQNSFRYGSQYYGGSYYGNGPLASGYGPYTGPGAMPSAMQFYGQQQTMPGGSFTFPVTGMAGGQQMYIGGTPGFYDVPMGGGPGSYSVPMGGTPNGFSF
ncbi:MAG: hypothetical protein CME64_07060 [Halobacteriovoraceae bacterium]|nr:hypothetical protein [Halobacteriovoraceae bacterium]